jgi:hypothetical protein
MGTALTHLETENFDEQFDEQEDDFGIDVRPASTEVVDAEPESIDSIAQKIDDALESGSIEDSLNGLEQRLDHSERLVRLLTEKLELTASELGRVRNRTQTQRADTQQFEELNAEQQALRLMLNEFKEEWQDRYEGPALQKLSGQLEDVLDEVQRLPSTFTPTPSVESHDYQSPNYGEYSSEESTSDDEQVDAQPPADDCIAAEEVSLIETLKIVTFDSGDTESTIGLDDDCLDDCFAQLKDKPSVEAPISEWESAVEARDRCIEELTRQQQHIVAHFNRSLDVLSDEWTSTDPSEDSVCELETLKGLVHEQLRVAEIGISLSRAAVSRDRLAVENQRTQQERTQAETSTNDPSSNESPVIRRWMRFLTR